MVLPTRGLTSLDIGGLQAEQPMISKEGVASFDPRLEGRQHPRCPDRRFDPRPFSLRLSGACSPRGHCLRASSGRSAHRVSIFLHPFAPPPLPGFPATMSALTPARGCGLGLFSPLARRAGLLASRNRPSEPSVSNHRPAPKVALTPTLSASGLLLAQVWASPLDRRLARRYGRIEFVILRMAPSPSVVPHPALRTAQLQSATGRVGLPEGDSHLLDQLRLQAHDPGFRRDDELRDRATQHSGRPREARCLR